VITYLEESRLFRAALAALLLTAGLGCLIFLVFSLARDLSLWVFGRQVDAVIVDRWAQETSPEGASVKSFDYYLAYQFTTPDGRSFTRATTVGPREWVGLGMPGASHVVYQEQAMLTADWVQDEVPGTAPGEVVEVLYFPIYPAHNRLSDTRYIPVYLCLYVPMLVLALVGLRLGLSVLRVGDLSQRRIWFGPRDRELEPR
jgi:hypothetical protein